MLAWCGLDRADVLPVKKVVASWVFSGLQRMTFALVQHTWYDDAKDWRAGMAGGNGGGGGDSGDSVYSDEELRTVPEGLAAAGTLRVMGETVPVSFVSSRVDESFKLTAVLPAMSWPAFRLSGMAPVSARNDEWSSVGPMVKLGGMQVGGVVRIVLQGYADVLGIRQWLAGEVTDRGIDLRLVGRVHGGVEMSVKLSAPASASLNLRDTSWRVQGVATESSLQALAVRMHAEARVFCGHHRGSGRCSKAAAQRVEEGGWFHVCALSSNLRLQHGQLGYGVGDWRRAAVDLQVWVSGKTLTLTITNVDLSDWSRAARTLAQAIVPHAAGEGKWASVPPQCATVSATRAMPGWQVWQLPHVCNTLPAMDLPTTLSLASALERDNAFVAIKEEQPGEWYHHSHRLQTARFRAAMQAYKRGEAAWDTDEVVRRAIAVFHRPHKQYTRVAPRMAALKTAAPTDAYDTWTGTRGPMGGQRMQTRLHKITKSLDALQRKLQKKAAETIESSIAHERARLMHRWPMSSEQVAALLRAKQRHALAVSGQARRLAATRRTAVTHLALHAPASSHTSSEPPSSSPTSASWLNEAQARTRNTTVSGESKTSPGSGSQRQRSSPKGAHT